MPATHQTHSRFDNNYAHPAASSLRILKPERVANFQVSNCLLVSKIGLIEHVFWICICFLILLKSQYQELVLPFLSLQLSHKHSNLGLGSSLFACRIRPVSARQSPTPPDVSCLRKFVSFHRRNSPFARLGMCSYNPSVLCFVISRELYELLHICRPLLTWLTVSGLLFLCLIISRKCCCGVADIFRLGAIICFSPHTEDSEALALTVVHQQPTLRQLQQKLYQESSQAPWTTDASACQASGLIARFLEEQAVTLD